MINKKNILLKFQRNQNIINSVKITYEKLFFQRLLKHHFKIIHKIQEMNKITKNIEIVDFVKGIDKIICAKKILMDYDVLFQLIPELISNIENTFADNHLDKSELCICCYIFLGFDAVDISTYSGMTVSTIYSKGTSIRKKLKLKIRGDIKKFVTTQVSKKYYLLHRQRLPD
jgi:hypothetical protein